MCSLVLKNLLKIQVLVVRASFEMSESGMIRPSLPDVWVRHACQGNAILEPWQKQKHHLWGSEGSPPTNLASGFKLFLRSLYKGGTIKHTTKLMFFSIFNWPNIFQFLCDLISDIREIRVDLRLHAIFVGVGSLASGILSSKTNVLLSRKALRRTWEAMKRKKKNHSPCKKETANRFNVIGIFTRGACWVLGSRVADGLGLGTRGLDVLHF